LAGRPAHDGRHLHLIPPPDTDGPTQLELGDGDYDVDTPDLAERYGIDITVDIELDGDLEDLA
jgi:hypothetical protein